MGTPELVTDAQEFFHGVALVPPQQVEQPRALRRASQPAQVSGQRRSTLGTGPGHLLVPGGDECVRSQRIEIIGYLAQLPLLVGGTSIRARLRRHRSIFAARCHRVETWAVSEAVTIAAAVQNEALW
jgi:hypothetical protein